MIGCWVCLLAAGRCAGAQGSVNVSNAVVSNVYALLYDLMGDESDVSKLRIVKHERPAMKDLTREISKTAGQAHKQLEAMAKADKSLDLKNMGLPAAEDQTRKSIAKSKTKALLSEKGKDFELQLLLSQSEALTYGEHLALTAARNESDPQRAEFCRGLAGQLGQLRQKVLDTILQHYIWEEKG